jgi:genome maintenance exonuclease 1
VLNATKPLSDRQALMQWRDRVGVLEANRIAGTASRRGTLTHKQIKGYLLGEEQPCPLAIRPYWESLSPVLNQIEAVYLVEGCVFHTDLIYGGKVDCVIDYAGTPCLCDWKTADAPKRSLDRLYDAPLQAAAYCGAVNHYYAEYGLKIHHAMIVVAIPDQAAEVFLVKPELLLGYWEQWQGRLQQYYSY